MTGLRLRARDPELPARAGESQLCAPPLDTVRDWIQAHLLAAAAPRITGLTWEYARWKPGASCTCTYSVTFEDESTLLVVAKRYSDGKHRSLAERGGRSAPEGALPAWIAERAVLEEGVLLFPQVCDRLLVGTATLLTPRQLVRQLTEAGVLEAGTARKRRIACHLLRYKPERRAVYRVEIPLRNAARSDLQLGCRILPPAVASAVARQRTEFEARGGADCTPPLLADLSERGILLEPWLEVQAYAPDRFEHAELAGELLAQLHAVPCPSTRPAVHEEPQVHGLGALAGVDARLLALGFTCRALDEEALVWCHGDFHPDQVARGNTQGDRVDGRHWILDLDLLGPGDPAADLACWIADALLEQPRLGFREASQELLSSYANGGGVALAEPRLRTHVALELQARAAAAIRRLEEDAVQIAIGALERARDVAPPGSLRD